MSNVCQRSSPKRIPAILHAARFTAAIVMQLKRTRGRPSETLGRRERLSRNSGSDKTPGRSSRASDATIAHKRIPSLRRSVVNAHHCQFPATPCLRTMSVTKFGVSLLKVVATIERPASHHGTARPETKNSDMLLPARLAKKKAGAKQIASDKKTITQSMVCRCIDYARRIKRNLRKRNLQSPNPQPIV